MAFHEEMDCVVKAADTESKTHTLLSKETLLDHSLFKFPQCKMLLYYCFALVSTKSILAELEGKYNYFLLKTSFIFVYI